MIYDETTESLRINEVASSSKVQQLPNWIINNKFPALYDFESATAIEQTAKLHGAVQTLIDSYNSFMELVEASFSNFEETYKSDFDVHKIAMQQQFEDFIDVIETMVQSQNVKIENADEYMKSNIVETTKTVVQNSLINGDIQIALAYDENENLNIVGTTNIETSE